MNLDRVSATLAHAEIDDMAQNKATPVEDHATPTAQRLIGLSLGADLCWPQCFETILRELDLSIEWGGERVSVGVERVTIEPFRLSQPCRYDVLLDRLTHWYHTSREWIKKAVIMDGLYVLNNPWSIQSMEKHSTYAAMTHLGMPIPETWMVPPKSYDVVPDLRTTLHSYAKLFDLRKLGETIGYPMVIKPYDGGGWRGVRFIRNEQELLASYEESSTSLMHLQAAVHPHDCFVRAVGVGPQVRMIRYDASKPLHDRYTMDTGFLTDEEVSLLRDTTLTINAFFGWDFNSCESMRQEGVWHPIDFANACPDSQITSLHYHFPWIVMAKLKWAIYCAVTRRPFRRTLDWAPFYEIAAEQDMPYRDKLRAYASIAEERFSADDFESFCDTHLAHVDEIAWSFFGTQAAKEIFRKKVAALYPAHEVDAFTHLFFERVQQWRRDNAPAAKES